MTRTTSHHHDHKHMIDDFRKRFFVTLFLTIPVMALSPMIQQWMGYEIHFLYASYLLFLFSSVIFFYGGNPFLTGFLQELKAKNPGMMTLIAVAITVAYGYSIATVFGLPGMDFFWELATLILIMLLGHWLEMKSIAGASRELELLVKLIPSKAHLKHGDHVMDVNTDTLKENDVIIIKPGEKLPADGTIVEGHSAIDESMLTGESVPIEKSSGNKVIAGSINGNGSITVQVSHGADKSYLSQVIKLVQDAQQAKSKTQLLADNAAKWLTYIALSAGAITFFYWWFTGAPLAFVIERTVTVIVICCPHALGLAVPLVVAKSTSLSAKHGLLIKNRTAFENSRKVTTVIFDKTGTLTVGKFEVVRYESVQPNFDKNYLLQVAASMESKSEHPIATGIVRKAGELKLNLLPVKSFNSITGTGIEGEIEGKKVMIVSPRYIKDEFSSQIVSSNQRETLVYVIIDKSVVGYVALADQIRHEASAAINTLKDHHIKSLLLTGDNATVAESVANELKMDGFFAEVLPHQKLEKVKELQQKGEFVAMTGDGINDAPALAQADVGIAVGSGSDIAAETAGIILVNSNPKDIVNLILFGRATYRKMVQNLWWATGYNVIALPLAAGVMYKQGILLSPAIGAVLMSLSTIVVALNASRLKVAN
ncbi:MAG TPA: copper-translocating P-type ATPase [Bacteroidia bacterium]|nr:copper-translocating P-type ATPase [Bacteroidia bacterium]